MRRVPLWVTLLPLLAGLAGYWLVWDRFAGAFARGIAAVLPGPPPTIRGFPYRLEAEVAQPSLARDWPGLTVRLSAVRAVLNRGPWQPSLTVISTEAPRVAFAVPRLAGASIVLTAATGLSSVHIEKGRIARLSNVFTGAHAMLGMFADQAAADRLELHFRETPTAARASAASPRFPVQAQLVLSGEGVRLAGGDPLTLGGEAALTARAPLRSYAAWGAGGTAELKLTLADATGEVLAIAATAVPSGDGRLRFAGTLSTVCPATVRAAFTGTAPPAEFRARRPVRLAFGGMGGSLQLGPAAPGSAPDAGPVRRHLPPCPALRR